MWRAREAARLAEVEARHKREVEALHRDYRQRAPYETVVTQSKVCAVWEEGVQKGGGGGGEG